MNAAKAFYRSHIDLEIQERGSVNALAKSLGLTTSTVQSVIERDKFTPLRRLSVRINNEKH